MSVSAAVFLAPIHRFERPCADLAAASALFAALAREPVEVAAFAYLDSDMRLLGMRHCRSAAIDTAPIPLRAVVADALGCGAGALAVAHNHPSGIARASHGDIAATRALVAVLHPLGVRVVEHLIVTFGATFSFRAEGLL